MPSATRSRARRLCRWAGVLTVAVALLPPISTHDDVFAVHVVQHLLLGMLAPVLLALGAPLTIALRAGGPGVRRTARAMLGSRVLHVLTAPVLAWVLYVGTPFVLYFTWLYDRSLTNDTLHAAVHVHFLVIGALFFWPILGADPQPRRLSAPMRLLGAALSLPFHAFLGVALMSSSDPSLRSGGGLMWAAGDLLGLAVLGIVLTQWMREDRRAAAREDRALDALLS